MGFTEFTPILAVGAVGPLQILLVLVLVLVLVLFGGRGKISSVMGDIAKGITSFRKGLKEGDETESPSSPRITDRGETVDATPSRSESETTRTES